MLCLLAGNDMSVSMVVTARMGPGSSESLPRPLVESKKQIHLGDLQSAPAES